MESCRAFKVLKCLLIIRITVFGTSAKYLQSLMERKIKNTYQLSKLRMILSTGSPLSSETFKYVYNSIKDNIILGSITGGTDICGLFAGCNPELPVIAGEIQCRCLGMKVEAMKNGACVYGEKGDLVCMKGFPSQPRLWNDKNNARLLATYFRDGIWFHGDFVVITESGLQILGRSDCTLNSGGVRIGSAEIYHVIDGKIVEDSIVVDENDQLILFVQPKDETPLDNTLMATIRKELRENASPRHVPHKVFAVSAIPAEMAVKMVRSGQKFKGSLVNWECLTQYSKTE